MKIILLILMILTNGNGQQPSEIFKNRMKVSWEIRNERIWFELSAPKQGWVAIGFNAASGLEDTYLLMGAVQDGKTEVLEHYTFSPGDHRSFREIGTVERVDDVSGEENSSGTVVRFSLPTLPDSNYGKTLTKGQQYYLLMAYSREDDFQHHSMMRTSVKITL